MKGEKAENGSSSTDPDALHNLIYQSNPRLSQPNLEFRHSAASFPHYAHHPHPARPLGWSGRQQSAHLVQEDMQPAELQPAAAAALADRRRFFYSDLGSASLSSVNLPRLARFLPACKFH